MMGIGVACGGVSVLNAIATGGFGGAIQVGLCMRAEVKVGDGLQGRSYTPWGSIDVPKPLLNAVAEVMGVRGLKVKVESSIPPASGLKSSSALASALVSAVSDALGLGLGPLEAALRAVEASRRAGLTVTGALDDHLASIEPGVHVTYNLLGRGVVLYSLKPGGCMPVVLGLRGSRRVTEVVKEGYKPLKSLYLAAVHSALRGEWLDAMRLNGLLTATVDGVVDLVLKAYEAGAAAAGVTGKGPTLFALTRDPEPVAEAWRMEGVDVMVTRALLGGGC